jgi:mevalonate kinase
MTTAHAPGKIILFGEHAVVYGRPALAVPVTQVQATAEVEDAPRPGIWIEAPDVRLQARYDRLPPTNPLAAAIGETLSALQIDPPPPLKIQVHSSIPVASGLGSGAAVSVALIRALAAHLGRPLPDEQVSALAYAVEKLHHGNPSGIDNSVVAYARPVWFVKGQPIETLQVAAPFTLVIGDTGLRAPTRDSVAAVRRLWEADPSRIEAVFDRIGRLAEAARRAIESGEVAALGPLMDENHALLQELTVSSPELDRLVEASRRSGAPGAKLSGGGRGGNMIALAGPQDAIQAGLRAAGAVRSLVTTVAPAGAPAND